MPKNNVLNGILLSLLDLHLCYWPVQSCADAECLEGECIVTDWDW